VKDIDRKFLESIHHTLGQRPDLAPAVERLAAQAQNKSMDDQTSPDAFEKFVKSFERNVNHLLDQSGLTLTPSIDSNIALLAKNNPRALRKCLDVAVNRTVGNSIPETREGDRIFAFCSFVLCHRRVPKDQPVFNDVLYKIKTTDEILDPLRVFVTDKEFVKLYVRATVGDQYNLPTLDVIRNVELIDTYSFPESCCIKPTHASGEIVIRRDGGLVDKEKIRNWFGLNYYLRLREANYRYLRPKVIVEPLLFGGQNFKDYKFFCFSDGPKAICAMTDVMDKTIRTGTFFDLNWNRLPIERRDFPNCPGELAPPDNLKEMLGVVTELSRAFGFVRIDLYSDGRTCLVGEITNNSGAATTPFQGQGEQILSKLIFD
jgi:hypothetical protein